MPVDERLTHPIQLRTAGRVLKAREARLGCQRCSRDRILIEQELVDRIVDQSRRSVPVGVTASDPTEPLAQQFTHRMLDLAGLAPIDQTPSQPPAQIQPRIVRLQQNRSAVGTAVLLIKPHRHRLAK